MLYEVRAYGRQVVQPPLPNIVVDKNDQFSNNVFCNK